MFRVFRITGFGAALLAVLQLCACAGSLSGQVYPRSQARQTWHVEEGKVTDVDEVLIEGQRTYAGHAGGGYIGYELGRLTTSGRGQGLAGAVGAVAGAAAGGAIEEHATREKGLQISVELDQGATIAIVQAADQQFQVGQRVRVLRGPNGEARVQSI